MWMVLVGVMTMVRVDVVKGCQGVVEGCDVVQDL